MTFDEYQKKAYVAIQPHADNKEEVMHWAIGLGEEAGEALSVVKHKYYGGRYKVEDLIGELGDVLWHVAALCTASGLSMELVANYNMAKLEHRYPTGEFDNERSIDRHKLKFSETERCKQLMACVTDKPNVTGDSGVGNK